MKPTWVLSAPDGPHVGPMNLAIRDASYQTPDTASIVWFLFLSCQNVLVCSRPMYCWNIPLCVCIVSAWLCLSFQALYYILFVIHLHLILYKLLFLSIYRTVILCMNVPWYFCCFRSGKCHNPAVRLFARLVWLMLEKCVVVGLICELMWQFEILKPIIRYSSWGVRYEIAHMWIP